MNRKWIFFGCGGVLLLGFLIAGCTGMVAILGSGSGENGSGGGSGATDEAEQQTVEVGQQLDVGEVSWVVDGAEQATALQSSLGEFGESREGNFVVVDFTFTNNGSEAVTLDTASMALVDGQDRRFEADPDAFEYIEEGRNIFLEQVNPGVSREGTAIFTVAPDAADFTLELGDAAMFSDQAGLVQLDF